MRQFKRPFFFKSSWLPLILVFAPFHLTFAAHLSNGVHLSPGNPNPNVLEDLYATKAYQQQKLHFPKFPKSTYSISLDDWENRIPTQFETPPILRSSVAFWLKIYTQYSSRQYVLFDGEHPEVVYEVMDFRDLARKSKSRVSYAVKRRWRIQKRIKQYRKAFRRLIKQKGIAKTELQKRIISSIRQSRHNHSLKRYQKTFKGQTGQRDFVIQGISRLQPYEAALEEVFSEYGVPSELINLALVESSFNWKAVSRKGAVGPWQIIRSTARSYLYMSPKKRIDERLSPLKAAHAAIRLLNFNYRIAKNWPLAIVAYNSGIRPVIRLPRRYRWGGDPARLLQICPSRIPTRVRLGYAGKHYYSEFLAMVAARAYQDRFYSIQRKIPEQDSLAVRYKSIVKPVSGANYASQLGISFAEFRQLNPDIRNLKARLPLGFLVAEPLSEPESEGFVEFEHLNWLKKIQEAHRGYKRRSKSRKT